MGAAVSTKALAVKQKLRDVLAAMPITTTDEVQVGFGLPTRVIDKRYAFVGETRWESSVWATNHSRIENFAVTVGFSTQIGGGTAEETEAYVIGLAAAFESAVSANPSLDGLCISTTYAPKRVNSWAIDNAYEAQFETEVLATCRP